MAVKHTTTYICDRCKAESLVAGSIGQTQLGVAFVEANHVPQWEVEDFDLCPDCAMTLRENIIEHALRGREVA